MGGIGLGEWSSKADAPLGPGASPGLSGVSSGAIAPLAPVPAQKPSLTDLQLLAQFCSTFCNFSESFRDLIHTTKAYQTLKNYAEHIKTDSMFLQ